MEALPQCPAHPPAPGLSHNNSRSRRTRHGLRGAGRQDGHRDLATALGHAVGQEELAAKQGDGAVDHCRCGGGRVNEERPEWRGAGAAAAGLLTNVAVARTTPGRGAGDPAPPRPARPAPAQQACAPAGLCGLPPQDSTRRLVRSSCSASGLFTSMAIMVEATLAALTRSRSVGRGRGEEAGRPA